MIIFILSWNIYVLKGMTPATSQDWLLNNLMNINMTQIICYGLHRVRHVSMLSTMASKAWHLFEEWRFAPAMWIRRTWRIYCRYAKVHWQLCWQHVVAHFEFWERGKQCGVFSNFIEAHRAVTIFKHFGKNILFPLSQG